MSCPSDSFTKSIDLFEDRVGRRRPHEGLAVAVVPLRKAFDVRDEVADAAERTPPNGSLGDDVEPDLDLVEPGGVGRGVVDVEARAGGEPAADLGVLVGRIVVDDQMDVELLGYRGLVLFETATSAWLLPTSAAEVDVHQLQQRPTGCLHW